MKKYTRRRQTRSKKYSRRRSRRGGGSRHPKTPAPTPAPTPNIRQSSRTKTPSRTSGITSAAKLTTSKGVVVSRDQGHSHVNASSRAGISKADAQVSEVVRFIAKFPQDMDKFLEMVIYNNNLLNDIDVQIALLNKISINMFPAAGRLSTNGIIFISYICGRLRDLLDTMTAETNVDKKSKILHKIKQIEHFICLLDSVGCSWGIRPYNKTDMETIDEYYRIFKNDEAGLQEYYKQLNSLIDIYFPVLKNHRNSSHVVSSSMCRRFIPGHVVCQLPTLYEKEEEAEEAEETD